jgi:nitroreductase
MTHPKHAPSDHQILDVIRERWSPRAFDRDRPVSNADLLLLFEAARWAPSSLNEQPWRFIVSRRTGAAAGFDAMLAALDPSNRVWAQHAPVLALVVTSTRIARSGALNQSAWYDTGQAVGFLTLQATGIGLGVRQMEGFNREQARTACGVPIDFEPVVAMAIGYPGDPEMLASERHRAAERQPRTRHPPAAFVFEERWGQALSRG